LAVRNEIGVPQPSLNAGPTATVPPLAGNTVSSSPRSTRPRSSGNSSASAVPSLMPAIRASEDTVRSTASRPPTPLRVNPKLSWIGAPNSEKNSSSSEKPGSVVIRPSALALTGPIVSSRVPP